MEQSASESTRPRGVTLVAVRDLLFSSRISATARAENVYVKVLRGVAALADQDGDRAIVDLNEPDAVAIAAQWKSRKSDREVIGFVSHVDAETIKNARDAGLVKIYPRSQFVQLLPALLRG